MELTSVPAKLTLPFANDGGKRTIPVPSQIGVTPGAASFTDGFPPLTRTPVNAGGTPPSGLDMNGVLFSLSAVIRWLNAGGTFPFDPDFAADSHIGGYPKGACVLRSNGSGLWLNTVDGNTNDPDSIALSGSGWIPLGSGGFSASVYASAEQTLAAGGSKVIYDSVEFDSAGLWDAENERFLAPIDGLYRVSGSTYLPAVAGNNLAADIYVNGVITKRCCQFPQVSDVDITLPFNAVLNLRAGDYVEMYLNASLADVSAGSGRAYVFAQIEYLGR